MYSKITLNSYCLIPKAELRTSLEEAKETFTAYSEYGGEGHPMYQNLPESFGVPLYHFKNWSRIAKKVIDTRIRGSKVRFKFTSSLRDGQVPVVDRFLKYYKAGRTGFELEGAPGFGKTVVILKMIQTIGLSTLVIVPRANLVEQWCKRILEHTDLRTAYVGMVNGKRVKWQGCSIVVALIHSVKAQMHDNHSFHNMFGTVVFDEVDRSVPPSTFAPVLGYFPSMYRIGASATVNRRDGLDIILKKHISQVCLSGGDAGRMVPKVLVINFPGDSGALFAGSATLNRRGMLLSKLAKNIKRNLLIAKYTHLMYKSGRRIIILSDRTEQLYLLRGILNRIHAVPLTKMGYYCDTVLIKGKRTKIKASEVSRAASACKIILGTYGKVAIGTDIPDLAGLIYATPQSEVEQTQGRIERSWTGKKQPVVVDIVDTAYRDAENWARRRRLYYMRKGLYVKVTKEGDT